MRIISALAVLAMLTTAAACGEEPVQKPGETPIPPVSSGIEKVLVPRIRSHVNMMATSTRLERHGQSLACDYVVGD